MGKPFFATPSLADGMLYLRARSRLFMDCVKKWAAKETP